MAFRSMNCPSCRKNIQVPDDVSTAVCMYCGEKIFCDDTVQASSGPNVDNLLGMARTAEAGRNFEESEKYYTKVLELAPNIAEAWFGKGRAAGWQSSPAHIRLEEMRIAFQNALATAPDRKKDNLLSQCMEEANTVTMVLHGLARENMLKFICLQDTWKAYIEQTREMILFLNEISLWKLDDRKTLENIIDLCRDNIEGIAYKDIYDNNNPKAWNLAPEYETVLRERLNGAVQSLKNIDPTYVPPKVEAKKPDACFVVTATMGDPQHPTVMLMRKFRDEILLKSESGRSFVSCYYIYGPKLAKIIGKSRILRRISYIFLIVPAAWIARQCITNTLHK